MSSSHKLTSHSLSMTHGTLCSKRIGVKMQLNERRKQILARMLCTAVLVKSVCWPSVLNLFNWAASVEEFSVVLGQRSALCPTVMAEQRQSGCFFEHWSTILVTPTRFNSINTSVILGIGVTPS